MTIKMHSVPLPDIAAKCHEHTILFYQGKPNDPKWCYELLRRALKLEDEEAFAHVSRVYQPQVLSWIHHHPRFDPVYAQAEDFAQDVILKFWFSVRGDAFDNFPRLNALLDYLKSIVNSIIQDYYNRKRPPIDINGLDLVELIGKLYPLESRIHINYILGCVEKALNDDVLMEQFELWIIYDMKPREIVKLYKDWDNPQQISRLRQRIKYRLENSKSLRTCLQGYLPPGVQ